MLSAAFRLLPHSATSGLCGCGAAALAVREEGAEAAVLPPGVEPAVEELLDEVLRLVGQVGEAQTPRPRGCERRVAHGRQMSGTGSELLS